MKKFAALIGLIFLLISTVAASPSGSLPAPVHVNVPNHMQETEVWCWVAVTQQVIEWSEGSATPQCGLVSQAYNIHPAVCCAQQSPTCVRTGSMAQIQGLIKMHTGRSSRVIAPDAAVMYDQLRRGKPVIIQVRTNPMATHVIVLTGMTFMWTRNGALAILEVNDPMSVYTNAIPYSTLWPYIVNVLVID